MKTEFTNGERRVLLASCTPALLAALAVNASAMHIMEGFLPQGHAIAWGVVCLPFLVWGFLSIQKIVANHRKAILLLAMMGAYAFVLSALKMPAVLSMLSVQKVLQLSKHILVLGLQNKHSAPFLR